MIRLKTPDEIAKMRRGGQTLARILNALAARAVPGATGLELDAHARRLAAEAGAEPSFLNYRAAGTPAAYPFALCVSVNDCVVHGFPNGLPFQAGDVVSLDLGLKCEGMFTDMALTLIVGVSDGAAEASRESARLVAATEEALALAIPLCRPGHTLGDIGYAVEQAAKRGGFGLVRELGGHGVGHKVHEDPHVPNFGKRGTDLKLKAGMVLAIEPMFTLGSDEVIFHPDGYTVTTADGALAAHFEHTIAITDGEPEVLTRA